MALPAPLDDVIPEPTIQVARAAFPNGNSYMRMRDALGPIYTTPPFAPLFSHTGRPAEAPAQLALITVMPFAEGLSDAQAADAVRARIDWPYALALELTDPGFDAAVLSEFRQRLLPGHAELLVFETMLSRFREQGWLKAKGRQRTDSTHVLAALQTLNRLECIGATLRHALNVLATVASDWLQAWVPAVWCARYRQRFADYRLPPDQPARSALAEQIGTDGRHLLGTLYDPATPAWLREISAVQTLRQVWLQQFYASPADQPVRWRCAEDLPPAPLLISSPYAPEARDSKKRETEWTGYKVHVSETCEDDAPHLITDVTTPPATTSDFTALPLVQANVASRQLTPGEQIVDAGYVTADHLLTSRTEHGIDLRGPVADDQSWHAHTGNGFAAAPLVIDWDAKHALCPQGQRSVVWMERPDRHGQATVQMKCSRPVCAGCARRGDCPRSTTEPRPLRLREREHDAALQTARARQQPAAFKQAYACRAGVEGTIAQGTHTGDLRRSRDLGFVNTRLMHLLVGAALNFVRVAAWLAEIPRARTRPSAFAALAAAAAR
jgi:transposase